MRSYYSTVLTHPAEEVWEAIRDFNGLATWFAPAVSSSVIEDGKDGDAVGAVRRFVLGDDEIREHLLTLSDLDRTYSYEFWGEPPFPVDNYVATLKVTPVTSEGHSFVEWWTDFDCERGEQDRWGEFFAAEVFAPALKALDDHLTES